MRFGEQSISNALVLIIINNVIGLIRIYKYNALMRFNMNDPENQLKYDCRKIRKLHLILYWIAPLVVIIVVVLSFYNQIPDKNLAAELLIGFTSILATLPIGRRLFKNKDYTAPSGSE